MRLALICPALPSHVAVFQTLARALAARGHESVLIFQDGGQAFLAPGAGVEIVTTPAPQGCSTDDVIRRAASPGGLMGILRTVADSAAMTDALCRHAPAILRAGHFDAVIADQMEPAGGLVARALDLPYLSLACALPLERDARIPPPWLDWPHATDEKGLKQNRGGESVARLLLHVQRRTIRDWAARFGLAGIDGIEDCLSPLGTIAQLPQALDFPRAPQARPLLQVGALRAPEPPRPLPFAIDPARPFVFMSLGTLQGHRAGLFRAVARACRALGAQLLIAHCGGLTAREAAALGASWVTDFAPQRAVLARADLCVTHCGQNTVLDALEAGTPMLALPLAFDQPGIAARIVHHGVGLKLSARRLTPGRAQAAIARLLSDPGYAGRARSLGAAMRGAGGLERAVAEIERLLAPEIRRAPGG